MARRTKINFEIEFNDRKCSTISEKIMLKSRMIERVENGVYMFLPLGIQILEKLNKIFLNEIEKLGFESVNIPSITSINFWNTIRPEILNDMYITNTGEKVFSATCEEIVYNMFDGKEIKIVQTNWHYRKELRTARGMIRTLAFIMQDCYLITKDSLVVEQVYNQFICLYKKIVETLTSGEVILKENCEGEKKDCEILVVNNKSNLKTKVGENNLIEVGHVFNFGKSFKTKYFCGSFGIGLTRLLQLIIELNNQNTGQLKLPTVLQPYFCFILSLKKDLLQSEKLYLMLCEEFGEHDVLYDDTKQRYGNKMFVKDFFCIPYTLVVCETTVEVISKDIKKFFDITAIEEIVSFLKKSKNTTSGTQ